MLKKILSILLTAAISTSLFVPTIAADTVDDTLNVSDDNTFQSHFINLGGDPWVTYHDGWYYYMVTGNGFYISKSRELDRVNSNPVSVFALSDLVDGENLSLVKELWAPELHFIDGYWYIYFTAYDGVQKDDSAWNGCTGTPKNHRMYVLKSKTADAQGEYEFMGQIKEVDSDYIDDTHYNSAESKPGHWAIDQSIFKWNGKLYAVWSGWSGYTNIDQRIYVAEMSDPCTISGERVELSRPEFAYETYSVIPAVNEAPQPLISPDGKTLNIAFSVNRFDDCTYALGLLTLKENGNPLNADDWVKTEKPVFETNEENSTYSVGHCSFVPSPDMSDYYMIYHARRGADVDTNPREIRVQQFSWNEDGTPYFPEALKATDLVAIPSGTAILNRTKIEAEDTTLSGGAIVINSTHNTTTYDDDYYSGGKRISLAGAGRTATFTYNAPKAGKYTISLLASGNSNTNSGLAVTVNGAEYMVKIHGNMGNLNIFGYYDLSGIELKEGENTISVSYTANYKNGAYLDRIDILNEADATDSWAKQDAENLTTEKKPILLQKVTEPAKKAVYNKEYTFNDFGDFDKYWFSSEPFVDDPEYQDVITTCRAGGNKRLQVAGEEFKNISDFKASVEITPAAAHENAHNPSVPVADETSINSGILFRIGKTLDFATYSSNICNFDGYRCFLTVSGGAVKMQLSRYYFANDTAIKSTNKILYTTTETIPYTPGDTYIISLTCIGNSVNAIAYNAKNPDEIIEIKNQSIETSVAETIESGKLGLFVNCSSRVTFSNMKITPYDISENVTQEYDNLQDFVIKSNIPDKTPTVSENGIITSTGALKMQALDNPITYTEKTFKDFYNIDNYDIYGSRYHTTSNKVSTFGATFDTENSIITTADAKSKLKIDGTENMTDFSTEFTVTKLVSNSLYGGIAFRIQDDDFRTDTFGTRGYMLYFTSASTSKDVKIILRKYSTATAKEENSKTASGLLETATNGVTAKINVKGQTLTVTIADAKNPQNTYSTEFSLIPTGSGEYYDSGSLAFVTNGNHSFENISLNGTVPTNLVKHEKEIYNLYNENYYKLYGDKDSTVTFSEDKISTSGQSKVKIKGYTNVEDLKASVDIKKTNGNALYGGIAFRIQDVFFEKATYGTPGYMIFAYSAAGSMNLNLRMRNYSTASAFAYKEVVFEGFLAAANQKNIRMELEVIGNTLAVTVYDLTDLTRKDTAVFSLTSDMNDTAKAGNFKGGSIALVSNGTHEFSNISISELVTEAPYTQVENFEAEADFTLPNATTIQCGIMFYVNDSVYKAPGLTGFSINAIRTSNSANNAITLQLVRYGTLNDGSKNINLGALSGNTNAISNLLNSASGAGETVRLKLRVARGTIYYKLINTATGEESKEFSSKLDVSSIKNDITYNTAYHSGGIGIFTNNPDATVSNFKVTHLSDCIVDFSQVTGGRCSGDGIYTYGENIEVIATPEYGYSFGGWYNGNTLLSDSENYSFTLTENITLTPKFIPFPLKYTGTDTENKAVIINLDSVENVTEVGFEVTVKSEGNEISTVLSSKYINPDAKNKKFWISTSDKIYYCDINGDSIADTADLVTLRKGLINNTPLDTLTADLTEDKKVNLRDLVRYKKISADVELEFTSLEDGYNYPFVIGNLLNNSGKQYIKLNPFSVTGGKKVYGAPCYLSFDGKTLTNSSSSENHTPFGKIRIACVGDSLTQGVGATGWASGDYTYAYPEQLDTILGEDCIVKNFGVGGSYTWYYEGRNESLWYPNTAKYQPSLDFDADIVIMMLGTNDARYVDSEEDSASFGAAFEQLLNSWLALEHKPTIYVCNGLSMKKYDEEKQKSDANWVTRDDKFRTYIHPQHKAVAEKLGLEFIDTYNGTLEIIESTEGLASDFLHGNDTGYRALAEFISESISLDIFY